jgi:hypothetical protein
MLQHRSAQSIQRLEPAGRATLRYRAMNFNLVTFAVAVSTCVAGCRASKAPNAYKPAGIEATPIAEAVMTRESKLLDSRLRAAVAEWRGYWLHENVPIEVGGYDAGVSISVVVWLGRDVRSHGPAAPCEVRVFDSLHRPRTDPGLHLGAPQPLPEVAGDDADSCAPQLVRVGDEARDVIALPQARLGTIAIPLAWQDGESKQISESYVRGLEANARPVVAPTSPVGRYLAALPSMAVREIKAPRVGSPDGVHSGVEIMLDERRTDELEACSQPAPSTAQLPGQAHRGAKRVVIWDFNGGGLRPAHEFAQWHNCTRWPLLPKRIADVLDPWPGEASDTLRESGSALVDIRVPPHRVYRDASRRILVAQLYSNGVEQLYFRVESKQCLPSDSDIAAWTAAATAERLREKAAAPTLGLVVSPSSYAPLTNSWLTALR